MEGPEEAQAERDDVQPQLVKGRFKSLSSSLSTSKELGRIPRIVSFFLPLSFSVPGTTVSLKALPVIEVDSNKFDATNFIGKAIDLGTKSQDPYHLDAP